MLDRPANTEDFQISTFTGDPSRYYVLLDGFILLKLGTPEQRAETASRLRKLATQLKYTAEWVLDNDA